MKKIKGIQNNIVLRDALTNEISFNRSLVIGADGNTEYCSCQSARDFPLATLRSTAALFISCRDDDPFSMLSYSMCYDLCTSTVCV